MPKDQIRRLLVTPYVLLVLLPTLACVLYNLILAAPGYISRAQVMVEQDSPYGGADLAMGLLPLGDSKSKVDTLVVRNFMQSRTMLNYLDGKHDLRAHYSGAKVDPWRRLDADASAEEFLDFYQRHLTLHFDEESLTLGIEFLAFESEFAQAVVQDLVSRSEEFVNEISRYLAREQLQYIKQEVEQANQRLREASLQIIKLQRENEVMSPEKETESVGQILAGLEAELAQERTKLKTLAGYLNRNAPDMVASRQRIAALQEQIEQERGRLVGSGKQGLNDLMLQYQDAETALTLATEVYKTTLASMEQARLEAVRKAKFLVSVDLPNLPDEAEHPRTWYWAATIFVALNLFYFVAILIVATIRDHRE